MIHVRVDRRSFLVVCRGDDSQSRNRDQAIEHSLTVTGQLVPDAGHTVADVKPQPTQRDQATVKRRKSLTIESLERHNSRQPLLHFDIVNQLRQSDRRFPIAPIRSVVGRHALVVRRRLVRLGTTGLLDLLVGLQNLSPAGVEVEQFRVDIDHPGWYRRSPLRATGRPLLPSRSLRPYAQSAIPE